MNRAIYILIIVSFLCGCSNRAIYDNLLLHERNQCLKDSVTRHEKCIFDQEKSYEEYKKERKQHIEKMRHKNEI